MLLGSKCSGLPPDWDVNIYLGDSSREALVRCISPPEVDPCEEWDIISFDDPRLDEMMAITLNEFEERQKQIIDSCEKWK